MSTPLCNQEQLHISEDGLRTLYSIFERGIATWLGVPSVQDFFNRNCISNEQFHAKYESEFLEVFKHVFFPVETEGILNKGKILNPLLSELHLRNTKTHQFLSVLNELKRAFLEGIISVNSGISQEILHLTVHDYSILHKRFDFVIEGIISLFSVTRMKILEGYREAFDIGSIISITDTTGRIIYVNDLFCKLSEYSREELIGSPHSIVRHPDMPKEVFKDLWNTIDSGKSWFGIVKNRKKGGGYYWVKTMVMPIFDTAGEVSEYISIRTDITELENIQEELRGAILQLRELDNKKNDFISITSHELRTPMTAVHGYISMILDGDAGEINEQVRACLMQVNNSTVQLISIINDMLDIAKLESGDTKMFFEYSDFKTLIEEVSSNFFPMVHEKSQIFTQKIEFDHCFGSVDRMKFKQLLVNILGNAIKFTPNNGEIGLRAHSDDHFCIIEISDTGIGIPQSHLVSIFEKFSQVKNPLTRDVSGTGLGLAICKKIVEDFQGTLEVSSVLGKGSIFTIRIPISDTTTV